MRHICLPLLLGTSLTASAQTMTETSSPRHLFTLNIPVGKLTNLRPQYEQMLSKRVGLGVRGAWYYGGDWPGWQTELFGRYYFRPKGPAGFYGQAQVAVFNHRGQESYFGVDAQGLLRTTYATTSFLSTGAGFGLGYQWLPGANKHFVIDGMVGIKLYLQPLRGYCDCGYEGDWYNSGPGSAFNGRLGVGYAF